MFRTLLILMLCSMALADKIFMVSMLDKDIYTTTIEVEANETAEIWFKRFYPNIWKRTVIVQSLTSHVTFNICSYHDQPPSLLIDCFNNTSYFEQKLYPYNSLILWSNSTKTALEIDTYPPMTSPHMTPLIIGIITLAIFVGCLICYCIYAFCKIRRRNYANMDSPTRLFSV